MWPGPLARMDVGKTIKKYLSEVSSSEHKVTTKIKWDDRREHKVQMESRYGEM